MRTITTTSTLYKFEELSESAQKTALDKLRDWNVDAIDWWDYLYDNFKKKMPLGYYVGRINFSGFWSQGDGAKFNGIVTKNHNQCLALLPCDLAAQVRAFNAKCRLLGIEEIVLEFHSKIDSSGHYEHSGCMSLDCPTFTHDWDDTLGDILMQSEFHELAQALYDCNEIDEAVIKEARGYADDLYRDLEKEYEYLTSDEAVSENIIHSELEFTEDGDLA